MQQRGILVALFVLLELAILIELGRGTTTMLVLTEVFCTALLGYLTIQLATKQTGIKARLAIWNMRVPGRELLGGFMTLLGGVLLIMPGIISDIMAVLLIFPLTQKIVYSRLTRIFPIVFKR